MILITTTAALKVCTKSESNLMKLYEKMIMNRKKLATRRRPSLCRSY